VNNQNNIDNNYLIELLYSLSAEKRNNFLLSNIHPVTLDKETIYGNLNNRNSQTQC
jgi:hypothetical protein